MPTLLGVAEHVTAVDLSPEMVKQAREALAAEAAAGRVDFAVASADRLPFPDKAFDTVVCHRLLHHLADPAARAAVLREAARVARRAVVASFSDATTLKARLQRLGGVKRRRTVLHPADFAAEAQRQGLTLDGAPIRLFGPLSLVAVAVLRVEGGAP